MIPSTPRCNTPDRCAKVSPTAANRYGVARRMPEYRIPSRTGRVNNSPMGFSLVGAPARPDLTADHEQTAEQNRRRDAPQRVQRAKEDCHDSGKTVTGG